MRVFLKTAYTHLEEEDIPDSICLFNLSEKGQKIQAKKKQSQAINKLQIFNNMG